MNRILIFISQKYIIIEFILILIYLFLILFSILVLPLNITLGVICILFLPGYNLISIIKPNLNSIQKFGYVTILSLMIDNFVMIFSYLLFYNISVNNSTSGFFFNPIILITTIQIINLFLLFVIVVKKKSLKTNHFVNYGEKIRLDKMNYSFNKNQDFKRNIIFKKKLQNKIFSVYLSFFISIICLCISCLLNTVSDINVYKIQMDYR